MVSNIEIITLFEGFPARATRGYLGWSSVYLIKVNKWFPSSKKCSKCGKRKKKLKISQRIYRCKYCGLVIDRDLNAAINIKNEGIRILK